MLGVFVIVFTFFLGGEVSKYFYSETHFEANILDHYIYENGEFQNVKASEIFANSNKKWIEICDHDYPKSEKPLKVSKEIVTDSFLSEYLHTILLRSDIEIAVLKFDQRKYRFDSDVSCALLDAVSVSANKYGADGKKTLVRLREIR